MFAIDIRGLAAFRIGLGCVLLLDLINRAGDFAAHYGSRGVLPASVYFAEFENHWHLSIHLFTTDTLSVLLFGVAIVAAIFLIIGWQTRLSTVVSWLLLISLHSRNPFVLQGGDDVLRALLFWALFLPLGATASIDNMRRTITDVDSNSGDDTNKQPPNTYHLSMATLCLTGQVILLYGFASASKLANPVWWQEGLGVYYALGVEQFTTRIGLWLRSLTEFVIALNYITLAAQISAPILLLIPIARQPIRMVLTPAMIALHLGFALAMRLGMFSLVIGVMWIPFLPSYVWDRLSQRWSATNLPPKRWLNKLRKRIRPQASNLRAITPSQESPVTSAVLACIFVYLLWWNLAGLDRGIFRMPVSLRLIGPTLRLEQRFKMFSNPPRWSQWFVVVGQRFDGTEIDVTNDHPPQFAKPDLVSATFKGQRWRKYMNKLGQKQGEAHRKHFGAYVCHRWESEHPSDPPLTSVKLIMMRQATPPPGKPRRPADRVLLTTIQCSTA